MYNTTALGSWSGLIGGPPSSGIGDTRYQDSFLRGYNVSPFRHLHHHHPHHTPHGGGFGFSLPSTGRAWNQGAQDQPDTGKQGARDKVGRDCTTHTVVFIPPNPPSRPTSLPPRQQTPQTEYPRFRAPMADIQSYFASIPFFCRHPG